MTQPRSTAHPLRRHADVLVAAGMLGVLFILIVPLHSFVLDMAITVNLTIAILVLLITLSVGAPLEFNTFPSLLLFTTLFRLALNVASTRLILNDGAAGEVIQAFGDFVVGGNLVVGLVIFVILVTIQFVVITKGSSRISEVAARFTLDAMPGKQMAIDADLNAGLLTEQEARDRRSAITQEAEFYGAMDGAGKFVRGDAIAGLIITVINIVGGVAIGSAKGMDIGAALQKYAILTVGDGLVSQIPALVIAIAAGTLITKTKSEERLSVEMATQFLRNPAMVRITAFIILAMGLVPGIPFIPFAVLSAALLLIARMARGWEKSESEAGSEAVDVEASESSELTPEALNDLLRVDRIAVEIGYRLIPLVDAEVKGGLLDHIQLLRRQFATSFGFVVPPIRMRDNLSLEPNEYRVLLAGEEVARGSLHPDRLLAMNPGLAQDAVEGIETQDPTFGLPATWIAKEDRGQAEVSGYTIIDPEAVLVTHLTEILKGHAHEILSREDVQDALDRVKKAHPTVVQELTPDLLPIGSVQQVFASLLMERIPILNLPAILETLADRARETKSVDELVEAVRLRLGRLICEVHCDPNGQISALSFDPAVEQKLANALGGGGGEADLSPAYLRHVQDSVVQAWQEAQDRGQDAVLVTRPQIRRHIFELLRNLRPPIPVLSLNEVVLARSLQSAGLVRVEEMATGAPPPAAAAAQG